MRNKTKNKKLMVNFTLMFAILGILIWLIVEKDKEKQLQQEVNSYQSQALSIQQQQKKAQENKLSIPETEEDITGNEDQPKEKEYPQEEVIQFYKGYSVCAKLVIPSISLETYVLEPYSIEALNVSVTKFWGANPNDIGNFCVAGHNFKNANMFRKLNKVKVGDSLFLSDHQWGKVEYQVTDIQIVYPEDVSCLAQDTAGIRQVTLITCTNDSKKRIIVKAEENSID